MKSGCGRRPEVKTRIILDELCPEQVKAATPEGCTNTPARKWRALRTARCRHMISIVTSIPRSGARQEIPWVLRLGCIPAGLERTSCATGSNAGHGIILGHRVLVHATAAIRIGAYGSPSANNVQLVACVVPDCMFSPLMVMASKPKNTLRHDCRVAANIRIQSAGSCVQAHTLHGVSDAQHPIAFDP